MSDPEWKCVFVFYFVIRFRSISYRKPTAEQIPGRVIEDIKASPQGGCSPTTPSDRAAQKRAELRRMEQERRRREAVSGFLLFFRFKKVHFRPNPMNAVCNVSP